MLVLLAILYMSRDFMDEFNDIVQIDDRQKIILKNAIEMYRDPGSELTVEQVIKEEGSFHPVIGNPALGYTRDTVWFRIKLQRSRETQGQRTLTVAPAYLDHLSVWTVNDKGVSGVWHTGKSETGATRANIDIPEGHSELYLQVKTGTTLAAIVTIWMPDAYVTESRRLNFDKGLLIGVLLLVCIFNLIGGVLTGNKLLLYSSGYLGFTLIALLDGYGDIGNWYISDWNQKSWRSLSFFSGFIWLFWCLLFAGQFELRKQAVNLYRLYQLVMFLAVIAIVSAFTGDDHYSYVSPVMRVFGVLMVCLTLKVAWKKLLFGDKVERVAGFAFILHASLILPNLLYTLGVVSAGKFGLFGAIQGTILYVIAIQFAIILNARQLELEKNKADLIIEQERQARKEQGQFLAMITHEVRTPLAVIDMSMQSLKAVDPDPPHLRAIRYERITGAVRRMTSLLNLKLEWNIKHGLWNADADKVCLISLSFDIKNEFTNSEQKRIHIKSEFDHFEIIANAAALRVALFNLVENALKYSGKNSDIEIRIRISDSNIIWEIEDSGAGVASAMVEKIFEKYYRAGDTSGISGLGLGLYIARSVIERHQGRLLYRDAQSGGACFSCIFSKNRIIR